jgi:hypothetical protein
VSAGVGEQPKVIYFAEVLEARAGEKVIHELLVKAGKVVVEWINVTSEDHAHGHESIFQDELSFVKDESSEHVEISGADYGFTARG